MPKFEIILTRDITESAVVTVEAKNKDEAVELAVEEAIGPEFYGWCTGDGAGHPYVTNLKRLK